MAQIIKKHLSIHMIKRNSKYILNNRKEVLSAINELDEALGILQHHDAVTGTEKQHVTNDYFHLGE